MSEGPQERLRSFLEALVAGQVAAMEAQLTDDVVWNLAPSAGAERIEGRERMLEFLCSGLERCYRLPGRIEPLMSVGSDREAMCLARLSFETVNGDRYENLYSFAARFRGDRICEAWELLDTASWARQVGDELAARFGLA